MSRSSLLLLAVAIGLALIVVDAKRVQTKCAQYAAHRSRKAVSHAGRGVSRTPANPGPGAILKNNHVRIGISAYGSLGARDAVESQGTVTQESTFVGLQYLDQKFVVTEIGPDPLIGDATADGCVCEAWGASALFEDNTYVEGSYKSQDELDIPPPPITIYDPLINHAAADQFITVGRIGSSVAKSITVQHHAQPFGVNEKLWQINVTITNTGNQPITQLRYVRAMDWDITPTQFDECVDLYLGTAADAGGDLECVSNNGFVSGLPSEFTDEVPGSQDNITYRGRCAEASGDTSSVQALGSFDQGAAFLFNFHDVSAAEPLFVGKTKTFTIFYGAADNQAEADDLLTRAKIEVYSFGFPNDDINGGGDGCNYRDYRYIFGFGNVGGDPIDPTCEGQNCFGKRARAECAGNKARVESTVGKCVSLSFDGTEPCGV